MTANGRAGGYRAVQWHDEFNDGIQPGSGFVYPLPGDLIACHKDYRTPAGAVIPAGAIGEVTELRKPGSFKEQPGYIGCCVHFKEVEYVPGPDRWTRKPCYTTGYVLPWDYASDPEIFTYKRPNGSAPNASSGPGAPGPA